MHIGQPLDIGSHDAIDQPEMMNEPIARSPRRGMSKGFWSARSHHAAQARNNRPPFGTGQAASKLRGADHLAIEVEVPGKIVAEAQGSPSPLQFPE
ncbi:hypothetical protein TomTYG45_15970 [Sphingobium sp. TomTYG45]